jgi:hypothetical protein
MSPTTFPPFFSGLPFTGRQIGNKLKWLLAGGEIRQVMADVYVAASIPDSQELRAAAAALRMPPGAIACGRTAAWIHGIDTTALGPSEYVPAQWTRAAADIVEIDGGFGRPQLQVRVKGPIRDYRIDVAYPDQPADDGRRLGLEYDSDRWHSSARAEASDEVRRTELEDLGWHVISVRRTDLWGRYPALELAVGAFLSSWPRLPRRW